MEAAPMTLNKKILRKNPRTSKGGLSILGIICLLNSLLFAQTPNSSSTYLGTSNFRTIQGKMKISAISSPDPEVSSQRSKPQLQSLGEELLQKEIKSLEASVNQINKEGGSLKLLASRINLPKQGYDITIEGDIPLGLSSGLDRHFPPKDKLIGGQLSPYGRVDLWATDARLSPAQRSTLVQATASIEITKDSEPNTLRLKTPSPTPTSLPTRPSIRGMGDTRSLGFSQQEKLLQEEVAKVVNTLTYLPSEGGLSGFTPNVTTSTTTLANKAQIFAQGPVDPKDVESYLAKASSLNYSLEKEISSGSGVGKFIIQVSCQTQRGTDLFVPIGK